MAFDAFISYSHAADDELAPALQRGLQRLAKPWSRRQALRIFRDQTGLSVNPELWRSITNALDESDYFILLASPAAAQSEWVNQEITYWIESRPDAAAHVLPVVTAGTWVWDTARGDIDLGVSTAAPPALAGVFTGEPRHLDLVWARSGDDLDLRNPRFRDAVADLAAPIHGIPKDELESEDVRQHRKALLLRRAAVAALLVLVIGLGVAGVLALRAADTARGALRDLEDANGNIDDLTLEGERLAAANQEAEADLVATEAARKDAEVLAAEARAEAEEAVEAREHADAARDRAEDAQVAAEAEQLEAEQARAAAEEAQTVAEQGRDRAEVAAAEAADAEAAARRQEAQARAGEQAAQAAQGAAEAASDAARVAEAQARADEQAAREAGEQARQQEAEARSAQAAAQAGERLARAAEEAALAAEEVARAAEEAALAAEEAARAAEEVAVQAAATAELRRQEAEAATLAATLAQGASAESDPSLNALLSVESYCAIRPCGASEQPQGLRINSSPSARLLQTGEYDPERLDPFVAMIDSVSKHQDVLGSLPGWRTPVLSRPAVQVAASADGATIAALRDVGTIRVWHSAAPGGSELELSRAIGITVSDDGTTIAVVVSGPLGTRGGGSFGSHEEVLLVDVQSGRVTRATLARDFVRSPLTFARLSFQPGTRDIVLINFGLGGTTMLYDPTLVPAPGHDLPDYRISNLLAAWLDDGRMLFVGPGHAHLARPDGSDRQDIQNPHPATPTTTASDGNRVIIGYADGALGTVVPSSQLAMQTTAAHPAPVYDIAISADGDTVISSAGNGSVRRANTRAGSIDELAVQSTSPIPVATGRGSSDVLIMAVDDRIERRTTELSWASAFARRGVVAPPTIAGALLTATPTGHELSSPESNLTVDDVDLPAVVSADGTTLAMAGSRPRVGPVTAIATARPLDLAPGQTVTQLALSPDGTIAAAVIGAPGIARQVVTFDSRTGAALDTIELRSVTGEPAVVVPKLLVTDEVLVIRRFDASVSAPHHRIDVHDHQGAPPRTISLPTGASPMWLTTGPDALLYVGGVDGVITAYPTAGGEPFTALDVGFDDTVTAIATELSGGRLMAVGYSSGRVELWNLDTDAFITELSRHSGTITDAAVGQTAAGLRVSTTTPGGDGVVRTLDDPDLLRRTLCSLAGRDLTRAEWQRFVGDSDPLPCARGLS